MGKQNKTTVTSSSVEAFLESIDDRQRREECRAIAALMQKATGHPPKMWGQGVVGFGSYHYKYASGHEGDWFLTGFSPRKANLTLYLMGGFDNFQQIMPRLGRYKTGKSCLYINTLKDVDMKVLEELLQASLKRLPGNETL